MAPGSDIGPSYPSPEGAQPPKKTRRKKVQDPIGTSPWGDPSTPEAQSHQALIAAISEAASPVQDFIQALISAIVDGLGSAVTELGTLAQDLQITIGQGMTPAVMALSQMRSDLSTAIRGQMSQAAEYASAGLGQPVYYQQDGSINVVTAGVHPSIPLNPDHHVPGRSFPPPSPIAPPAPARPGQPHFPGGAPAPPGTGAPPPVPLMPPGAPGHPGPIQPGSVPGVPGFPGFPQPGRNPIGPRRWDGSAAAGSAASTPGTSVPGLVVGPRQITPNGPRTTPPPEATCGTPMQWGDFVTGGQSSSEGYVTWEPWTGDDPSSIPINCLINYNGQLVCHYPCDKGGGASPTPTPTQTPINPYDPTNSLPGTPTMPGPAPTTPTSPTTPPIAPDVPFPPAPPTTPTPQTTPPIAPDVPFPPAPPIPEPPTSPCPPGYDWAWTGYQYECMPSNYGPPPPTPEPGPTPIPEPTPEPQPGPVGGGGGPPSKPPACGLTKHNPCWVAANPPDEEDQDFYVMHGGYHYLAVKNKNALPKGDGDAMNIDVQFAAQMGGGVPGACDPAWQVNLVSPTGNNYQMLEEGILWDKIMERDTKDMDTITKMMYMSTVGVFFAIIKATIRFFTNASDFVLGTLANGSVCMGAVARSEITLAFLNILCLGQLRKQRRSLGYSNDFQCPVGVPSSEMAAAAWLGNEIDVCTFEAYVRANDDRFDLYAPCVRVGKHKFTALELKTLEKRHGLTRSDLPHRLRELGSLHDEDLQELETLFQQLPGPADITRFMMRDTDNQEIVTRFRLDDGFGDNFVGQLREWAQQQGVSEDVMRRFWRAHYDIPSPTQLYLMLHRFRHGGDPTPGGDIESDVRLALRQQDILPYWHDRLIGIAYHPLNRTDLNRAYEKGWIDDDRYLNGMYDNGYNDDDAKTLLRFASRERALAIRHADFTTAYAHGYIDPDTLRSWAESEGYEGEVLSEIQEVADFQLRVRTWEDQTKAIAHQFRACRITEEEARDDASALGIPESVIDRALGISELNTTCGTRREMVGSLCQALDAGFITPQEYVDRMRKLKYDQFAIDNYLGLCQNKIAARKAKEAAKAQKEAEREEEKAIREAEQAQRRAAAQAARLAKALATQERRRVQRNDKLERVGNKLGQSLADMDGPDASYVDMLWRGLQDIMGLSQDDAANVLVVTSASAKGMTRVEYRDWVYEVAPLALTEPWQLFPSVPVVANGHS